MNILAIDPGNEQSAFVVLGKDYKPLQFGKVPNDTLLAEIREGKFAGCKAAAIEMIASYGMAVGREVFETCVWIGRFKESLIYVEGIQAELVYRQTVKLHICHTPKAKDGNIRQALIDRFGPVGTKKNQGWFYGFKADIWQAYALGTTFKDMREVDPF